MPAGASARLEEAAPRDYLALLGLRSRSVAELLKQVERGLSFQALLRFKAATALPWEDLSRLLGIPARTLSRRREAGRLDAQESDRLLRAARLVQAAIELFEGDAGEARRWLGAPQRALGGETPLALARTETGAREVEALIGRLEHGVYA
jgi:putative toxin-antitoxin system antitoxin component (TIGR02293 family)